MDISQDKLLHMGACGGIAFIGVVGSSFLGLGPGGSLLVGAGLALTAGVGKELYDKNVKKTEFSVPDLLADFAGTIGGCLAGGGVMLAMGGL